MSEFLSYARLGLHHILDIAAVDHVLFLVALAAIYTHRDWRPVLWVVSAFTIGHSLTLALAVTGVLSLPTATIEFLIPVTILLTCIENVATRRHRYRPLTSGVFGLIHGAGFANYLRSMFVEDPAVPLVAFNVGIEIGQVVALLLIGATYALIDAAVRRAAGMDAERAARVRAIGVSAVVGAIAIVWSVQRFP